MADLNFEQANQPVTIVDDTTGVPVGVTSAGRIKADATFQAVVSTLNSSSTPLGAGATFTGTAELIRDFADVIVFCYADQNSAVDGLVIEWSTDGTNWDANDTSTITPTGTKQFSYGASSSYFRVRYTNGATPQGAFRLQTLFKPFSGKPSSHRIGDTISGENDAELSKSVITAKDFNGNFVNVGDILNPMVTGTRDIVLLDVGKSFVSGIARNSAGVPDDVIYVKNTSSTKAIDIVVFEVFFDTNSVWDVYLNPTVSADGTAQTIVNRKTADATSPYTQIYDTPTVTAVGTRVSGFLVSSGGSRLTTVSYPLRLSPTHTILLRRSTGGGGNPLRVNIIWNEV